MRLNIRKETLHPSIFRIRISRFLAVLGFILVTANSTAQSYNNQNGYEITGNVSDDNKEKLEYANVGISEYAIGTSTDKNGNFVLRNVPYGKVKLSISYVGYVSVDTLIDVRRNLSLNIVMERENFRLKVVFVTATSGQSGQATSSKISRNAIDHLQSTSLNDVLSLLPGGLVSNQNLSNAKQINLRNVSSNAENMNAFGVAIVKDGSPISNNANLQTMNPAVVGGTVTLSGGTAPAGGTDLRLLSTDDIESVEVIRGIPSVQYGDITSGVVIINSKAGKSPLRVTAKANPNVYEFSAGSGFLLGEDKGSLNVSGDYANNTSSPTQSYRTYQRSNINILYSNRYFDRLTNNTSINFMYGADRQKLNPDDEVTKTESKGDNVGIRLNTNGIFRVSKPWLTNIMYSGSVSYTSKNSYMSQQYTAANSPYSMTTTDGAILSNKPFLNIFDKDGNKITNIPYGEDNLYAIELPSSYVGRYDINGKEINAFAKITGNLYKKIGNTHHSIMVGADFKTDGNKGDGKTFSQTAPPYRNLSAVNASFRQRAYKDIPFVNQVGIYAQESFRYKILDRTLLVTGGVRYDKISVVKDVFSPRVNASFEILPDKLTIRGGYGVTAKAPSTLYLYPEQAYFEYVNINELSTQSIPEDQRLLITTTKVYDTQNKDLKIAKNKKTEIGFDLKINQARLSVTAFKERLQDGYTMATTVNSYKPFTYDQYKRTEDGLTLSESNPVLAQFYMPTNNLQMKTKGVEFDLNIGRIDKIRTSFSTNGMWIRSQSYSSDYTFFDDNSGTSGSSRTHIGLYDKEMTKNNEQRFSTALRATHNIPEIGFVITLTWQAIWSESQWYNYKNENMPVKYISKYDGLVYDFDPSLIDPDDPKDPLKLLIRNPISERLYIKEQYAPTHTFNINLTKEMGDYLRVSFFANNVFRNYPSVRSKRTPSSYLITRQNIFFGLGLSLSL